MPSRTERTWGKHMGENIRLSIKGILSHKLRSFLTMLGIIVGIAAIIAVVSTIKGTNEQIKNNLIGDGTNTVTVTLNNNGYPMDFQYETLPGAMPAFDESVREELAAIPKAENVSFIYMREYCDSLFYKNNNLSGCRVYGIDGHYFETAGLQITSGTGFSARDIASGRKIAIVDETAINTGFEGTNPIGKTLDIFGEPFTVVGVCGKKSQFEPVIETEQDYYMYTDMRAGSVYIPSGSWPVAFQYDEPYTVVLKAASTDDMTTVGKKAEDILNGYLSFPEGVDIKYKSNDLEEAASQIQQLSASTNTLLIGIACISLLVGGIGVMNIMLVSVTERTREIGLKKALGAKKRQIRGQFLTEAVILSGLGGVIGVVVGIILAKVVSVVALIPVAISTPAVIIAVVFSMAIGIIFGLAPSIQASNLNPIDALRYE